MKKLFALILALAMCLSMAACSGSTAKESPSGGNEAAPAEEYKLIFSTATAANAINHRAALYLNDLLQEATDGRMSVEIYTDGTMFGADRETIEAMQSGDCDLSIIATTPYVPFAKNLAVFDAPFLFDVQDNSDAMMDVVENFLTSDEGKAALEPILNSLPEVGFRALGIANQGFRELTCNREIKTMEDLAGLKIRTMENSYHMDAWKLLGANPTPMAFTEVFTALEQGTIDGQENPYELICTSKFYEVQDYIVNTHHISSVHLFSVSEKTYQSLPEDLRQILAECVEKTARWYAEEAKAGVGSRYDELVSAGANMVEISTEEYARMREVTQPVIETIRNDLGAELVDNFLNAARG